MDKAKCEHCEWSGEWGHVKNSVCPGCGGRILDVRIETSEELLKITCFPIDLERDGVVLQEAEDIVKIAWHHRKNNPMGCLGLAANQINFTKRLIVVYLDGEFVPMVNPVIIPNRAAGQDGRKEPCLSRPNKSAIFIKRFKKVRVQYNPVFKDIVLRERKEITLKKIDARCVQHEVDHLNGVLI